MSPSALQRRKDPAQFLSDVRSDSGINFGGVGHSEHFCLLLKAQVDCLPFPTTGYFYLGLSGGNREGREKSPQNKSNPKPSSASRKKGFLPPSRNMGTIQHDENSV